MPVMRTNRGHMRRRKARIGATLLGALTVMTAAAFVADGFTSIGAAQGQEGWSAMTVPAGFPDVQLNNVSCASSTFCMAVGTAANGVLTYAEAWNGTQWIYTSPLTPDANGDQFSGVSCVSSQFCLAVGSGGGGALTEQWNGEVWSVLAAPTDPNPTDSSFQLTATSCFSTSSCIATGTANSNSSQNMLAATWNGSGWSVTTVQSKAYNSSSTELSCSSPTFCVVLTNPQGGGEDGDIWNGTDWTTTPMDAPFLFGEGQEVSCVSSTFCIATLGVDEAESEPSDYSALVEEWNGATWSEMSVVNPQGMNAGNAYAPSSLDNVSCASQAYCVALGIQPDENNQNNGFAFLAEVWNGSIWQVAAQPFEPVGSGLNDIDCTDVSFCVAVGVRNAGLLAEELAPIGVPTTLSVIANTKSVALGANGTVTALVSGSALSSPTGLVNLGLYQCVSQSPCSSGTPVAMTTGVLSNTGQSSASVTASLNPMRAERSVSTLSIPVTQRTQVRQLTLRAHPASLLNQSHQRFIFTAIGIRPQPLRQEQLSTTSGSRGHTA